MKTINYIYVLTLKPAFQNDDWDEEAIKTVGEHFNYLKQLSEKGKVFLAGKTDYSNAHPDNFGLVFLSTESEDEANEIMKNDPAVLDGIMNAKLHPYGVALMNN